MKINLKIPTLILLVIFFASCRSDSLPNDVAFDSARWKNGDSRTRGGMAHNLQQKSILAGKTKSEVAELLGKPDSQPESENWLYEVDFGTMFGKSVTTPINLNVNFDLSTEKVTGTIFTGGLLFGIYTVTPPSLKFFKTTK